MALPPAWTALPKMDVARSDHTSVLVNKRLYIIGGNDGSSRPINYAEYLDLVTLKWVKHGYIPVEVSRKAVGACSVVLNGKIYVLGGIG